MSKYWKDPSIPEDGSTNVLFIPEVHGPRGDYTECVEVTIAPADPEVSFDELMDELVRVADEVDYAYSPQSIIGRAKDKQTERGVR